MRQNFLLEHVNQGYVPFCAFKHSHKHASVVITGLASLRHGSLTGHMRPAAGLHLSALSALAGTLERLRSARLQLAFRVRPWPPPQR